MKLNHFFRGTVRKEDVASAFLATALEQSPRFRAHFFRLVDADQAEALAEQIWTYAVEERRVDVTLKAAGIQVIIENKICAGAHQAEQLIRYYRECAEAIATTDRILAVYVAPRSLGKREVDLVNELLTSEPRGTDRAVHVSWAELAGFRSPEAEDAELVSGFATILGLIDELTQSKYLREGDRDVLGTTVDRALQTIRATSGVPLSRWTGATVEEIVTVGTNVTMWADAVFDSDEQPPHAPLDLWDGDRMKLTLRVKFKVAGHVKKSDPFWKWWATTLLANTIDIAGVGRFGTEGKGWLAYEESLTNTPEAVERRMAALGTGTLRWLAQRLVDAGFSLRRQA
jgi:hypothetical protein